jgi:hypothetical protein
MKRVFTWAISVTTMVGLLGGTALSALLAQTQLLQPTASCGVAQLDPQKMAWTILAYAEPNPAISVVATGVILGDTLWIGAASADAIAYRPLPRPAAGAR